MNALFRFLRLAWLPGLVLTALLAACNLNEMKTQQVFSFPNLRDSLKTYDRAVIVLEDMDGHPIDTLFDGKVQDGTSLKDLPAPHFDGGKTVVVIEGYMGGAKVYEVERDYDGETGTARPAVPVLLPTGSLSLEDIVMKMKVGDSLPLPKLKLIPENLSAKGVQWFSSSPEVLRVDASGMKALKPGESWIRASLGNDAKKSDSLKVQVSMADSTGAAGIDSLRLAPDTLSVAVGGAEQRYGVTLYPANAPSDIVYGSMDTTVATVSPLGWVRGIKAALTRIIARAAGSPWVADTAWVKVLPKQGVDSIRFSAKLLEIYQHGASEKLFVKAYPVLASQSVELEVRNPAIVRLENGMIQGLVVGESWIVAKSTEYPSAIDSIRIVVSPIETVDSVRVKPDTLPLFYHGESRALMAALFPANLSPRVLWVSSATSVASVDADGKVTPGMPGYAYVTAITKADSTKRDSSLVLVKKDTPRLAVGGDTTISLGQTLKILPSAPQSYGLITQFKADANGDGTYEVASTDLKEVSNTFGSAGNFLLRFYVMDTEGNDTTVIRKVKVVDGLVVQITSPKDGYITNQGNIDVTWSVDNSSRTDKETLKEGENIVARSAKDGAGNTISASIKVYLDTKPPLKPIVTGPVATVSNRNPTWKWKGGGEGSGSFRILLDGANMANARAVADTFYTPDSSLSDGDHTLLVQEKDQAGNWSESGMYSIRIDATPPAKPAVSTPAPVTNSLKPKWTWAKSAEGSGNFEYKLDIADFASAGTPTTAQEYSPATNLAAGTHTLYVRERDSVGNWSQAGSAQVVVDTTAPGAPRLTGTSPTNQAPLWKWTSGGGGSGYYRVRLADGNFPADAPESLDTIFTQQGAVSGTTYTLFVQERDAAGNWSKSGSLAIKYDLTSPTVAISTPQASGTYYTALAAISMSGTATGPNAVSKVTYSVDGGAIANATLGAGGSWSIPSIPVADGKTSTVTVTAQDALGNSGFATLQLVRDTSPPSAPVIRSSPASETKTSTGTWTWDAGNDGSSGSGLNGKYRYNLNNGTWTETTSPTASNLALIEGDNAFNLQEQDKVGNWSVSATNTVKLDTKGPGLAFTSPATAGNTYTSTTTTSVTIKGTASDAGVGVKSVECDLAGSPTADYGGGNWSVTANFPAGTTTVNCWANDNLGNKGASSFIKLDVNLPKPTINNLSVAPGMVLNTPSFTVNYNATVGGVNYPETKDVTLSEGDNTIVFTTKAKNAAGESGTLSVKYVLRSAAIFVDANAGGKNDGTSWANAYTTFEAAKASSKAQNALTQIWISKGTYSAVSSNEAVELPGSLIILGGFDAASLPSDTASSQRNLVGNRTLFLGYLFIMQNLNTKFEFNTIEFEKVRLFTANVHANTVLNFSNCKIWGLEWADDIWSIETDVAMTLNFLGTDVVSKVGEDEFNMSFRSPGGSFNGFRSSFTRLQTGKSSQFLGDNGGSDGAGATYTLDNCILNYEMENFYPQMAVSNPNSKVIIKNSQVRYGQGSILAAGGLTYTNNTNLP